ncbi:hypothetical protein O9993_08325 [Vibrio lentus]|nr:hypothetical protein [Vibrio lentus]
MPFKDYRFEIEDTIPAMAASRFGEGVMGGRDCPPLQGLSG